MKKEVIKRKEIHKEYDNYNHYCSCWKIKEKYDSSEISLTLEKNIE